MQDFQALAHASVLSIPVAILSLADDGDRLFVTDLYQQYKRLMYNIARRYFGNSAADIEDALGAAVERMCRYVEKFRAVDRNKMKSYVISTIENVCKQQMKKQKERDGQSDDAASESIDECVDPRDEYASAFDHADAVSLLESFQGLSDRERDLIRWRHIDQMEFSEIAGLLGVSEVTVRSALTRARKHLRALAEQRKSDLL